MRSVGDKDYDIVDFGSGTISKGSSSYGIRVFRKRCIGFQARYIFGIWGRPRYHSSTVLTISEGKDVPGYGIKRNDRFKVQIIMGFRYGIDGAIQPTGYLGAWCMASWDICFRL